jgi:hypothetical protein
MAPFSRRLSVVLNWSSKRRNHIWPVNSVARSKGSAKGFREARRLAREKKNHFQLPARNTWSERRFCHLGRRPLLRVS